MDFEKYRNKIPYPERPKKPILLHKATAKEAREYAEKLAAYEDRMVEWHDLITEYKKEDSRLYWQFKNDLLKELGITDHPKAQRLFDIAWDKGHSMGYSEVYSEAEELADLLR